MHSPRELGPYLDVALTIPFGHVCFLTSRQEVESHLRPSLSLTNEFFLEVKFGVVCRDSISVDCLPRESETGILEAELFADLS